MLSCSEDHNLTVMRHNFLRRSLLNDDQLCKHSIEVKNTLIKMFQYFKY